MKRIFFFMIACLFLLFAATAHAQDEVDRIDMKAQAAFNANNYRAAIDYWTRELKLSPKNANVLFNRALAYDKDEDTENALADYAAAIAINPADAEPYENCAKIYADTAMNVFDQNGDADATDKPDWDKAIAYYTAAIELRIKDVPDPKAWLQEKGKDGTQYALDAACESALIKLDPKDAGAWFRRAQTDPFVGDPDRELADYSEVIRLDPKNEQALLARARIYSDKPENAAKALADYSEALRLKPDKNVYIDRAGIYAVLNEDDKALADCDEALRLGGASSAYGEMVSIHSKEHDWDKVIADYGKIIELGADSDTYHERAAVYYYRKDWDNVIADMNKAVETDLKEANDTVENQKENGDDSATLQGDGIAPNSLLMRGDAFAREGMYDKALADFRHASGSDADYWQATDAEAWILATSPEAKLRNGRKAAALAMKTCLCTGWLQPGPVDTLAAAEAETGDWKKAIAYENEAIKTASDGAQDARDDDRLDADEKQEAIDTAGRKIQEYTARLALYEKKQPCRECKQLEW